MKNLLFKTIFLVSALVFFTACKKYDPDNPTLIFYDVEGEGYVFNRITNEAIPFAKVEVKNWYSFWPNNGTAWEDIYYIADTNGYYKVKFLKKRNEKKIKGYLICARDITYSSHIPFSSDYIKKQKETIKIDTIWEKW